MSFVTTYNDIVTLGNLNEVARNEKLRALKEEIFSSPREECDAFLRGFVADLLEHRPDVTTALAFGVSHLTALLSMRQLAVFLVAFNKSYRDSSHESYNARLQQRLALNANFVRAISRLSRILRRVEAGDPACTEEDRNLARMTGRLPG